MKILVVEDNKKLLESIVKEINIHFQCESCEDGEEALYLIKQDIYDLVVLDLMLPNLNGLDIDRDTIEKLLNVDREEWKKESKLIEKHLKSYGYKVPDELFNQLKELNNKL